jgi:hypothetical protein
VDYGQGFIHAHAGLRKVVRMPLSSIPEPIAHWRLSSVAES